VFCHNIVSHLLLHTFAKSSSYDKLLALIIGISIFSADVARFPSSAHLILSLITGSSFTVAQVVSISAIPKHGWVFLRLGKTVDESTLDKTFAASQLYA
jgi:hypothetical protein